MDTAVTGGILSVADSGKRPIVNLPVSLAAACHFFPRVTCLHFDVFI